MDCIRAYCEDEGGECTWEWGEVPVSNLREATVMNSLLPMLYMENGSSNWTQRSFNQANLRAMNRNTLRIITILLIAGATLA